MIYVPEKGRAWFGHYATPVLSISTPYAQAQTLLCDGSCYNSKRAKQMGQEVKDKIDSPCTSGTVTRLILDYPCYCTCVEYFS